MNKRNYKITPSNYGFKVEVSDEYGNNSTVYEKNVIQASLYIIEWWENSKERKQSNDLMAKAILEMKEIDSKNPNLREIQ
tara:strand:+ start:234 stop:473 length:240 start_codon:yes stop_codon:yes gene_type:complete